MWHVFYGLVVEQALDPHFVYGRVADDSLNSVFR